MQKAEEQKAHLLTAPRESFTPNPPAGIPGHGMKGLAKAEHRLPNPTVVTTFFWLLGSICP